MTDRLWLLAAQPAGSRHAVQFNIRDLVTACHISRCTTSCVLAGDHRGPSRTRTCRRIRKARESVAGQAARTSSCQTKSYIGRKHPAHIRRLQLSILLSAYLVLRRSCTSVDQKEFTTADEFFTTARRKFKLKVIFFRITWDN